MLWDLYVELFPEEKDPFYNRDSDSITNEQWLIMARWWRGLLLNESDWSQIPDNSLTEQKRQEWRSYRETLRNITSMYEDAKDIIFPDMPTK